MQQDLETFRASKNGSSSPVPSSRPTSTPVAPVKSQIQIDLETFRAGKGTPVKKTDEPKEGSTVGNMVKSIFSAPVTTIARPVQAVTALSSRLMGKDMSNEQIDEAYQNIPVVGGLIADTPKNYGDVKKDVGRGIQTVALGTGAPIAGGAAFGVGSSLEQGNDLLSVQTIINTAIGGVGGKVTAWIGKPLFNAAGKVIGTITPQVLKDIAGQGAGAVQKFMADNKLLGGAVAPLSEKVASGFQKIDDTIGQKTSQLFSKTRELPSKLYPGLSEESLQKRYLDSDKKKFKQVTTIPKASYRKTTDIYKNAGEKGNNMEEVLVDNGVRFDEVVEDGLFNTQDVSKKFRNDAVKRQGEQLRPAIQEADLSFQRVPISRVREQMITKINKSKFGATEKKRMINEVNNRYSNEGAEAMAHPNGYGLEDFYDEKISSDLRSKPKQDGSFSENFAATTAKNEGDTFRAMLKANAPEWIEIEKVLAQSESMFQAANFLESLHTKKVPETLFSRGVDFLGRGLGATAGAGVAGGYGSILGYHAGPLFLTSFKNMSNPVKAMYLKRLSIQDPPAFIQLKNALGEKVTERLMQLKLPAPGKTSYKDPDSIFYQAEGYSPTLNKQEAVDMASLNRKDVKTPKGGKSKRPKLREMLEGYEEYVSPDKKVIPTGPTPKKNKRLTELYGNLPIIR